MLDGVLFDFAGTLLVPRPAGELIGAAARAIGLDLAAGERDRLAAGYLEAGIPGAPYPRRVPESLRDVYDGRDLSGDAHRTAYVSLFRTVAHPPGMEALPEAVYEQILAPEGWIPYADAAGVVEEIARCGLRVGLVSNVGFDIRGILREHGLGRLAERSTLSFEVGAIKPDRRIFLEALRELGTRPERTLMVGDHPEADGRADRVGMRTLILPMTEPGTVHGLGQVLGVLNGQPRSQGVA
jgi:HAD superfamily hydrolase (TIGR01509 family)